MTSHDTVYTNARLATMRHGDTTVLENAVIAHKDGCISFIGTTDSFNETSERTANVLDLKGKLVTPGLIDCHTHIVFGGNRANEFRLRLEGASYEEIAKSGGGIAGTVSATRCSSEETLYQQAKARTIELIQDGVTTLEIKSGYGLNLETERKMLRIAQRIEDSLPVNVAKTFLGAHALPTEYADDRAGYIDRVCNEMIPQLNQEGLIDAVDVFCESIGFTLAETEQVFKAAKKHQLPIKIHAEQLTNSHGAELAARYQALSADHVEYLDEAGVKAMADNGTVAVLLPGAFYMLRETRLPPLELLRQHQVPIALATDCNPGSSPVLSLRLMLNMACQLFAMTPEEALKAVTVNAAKALGREKDIGSLELGKQADMVVWNVDTPEELCYWVGGNKVDRIIKDGKTVDL